MTAPVTVTRELFAHPRAVDPHPPLGPRELKHAPLPTPHTFAPARPGGVMPAERGPPSVSSFSSDCSSWATSATAALDAYIDTFTSCSTSEVSFSTASTGAPPHYGAGMSPATHSLGRPGGLRSASPALSRPSSFRGFQASPQAGASPLVTKLENTERAGRIKAIGEDLDDAAFQLWGAALGREVEPAPLGRFGEEPPRAPPPRDPRDASFTALQRSIVGEADGKADAAASAAKRAQVKYRQAMEVELKATHELEARLRAEQSCRRGPSGDAGATSPGGNGRSSSVPPGRPSPPQRGEDAGSSSDSEVWRRRGAAAVAARRSSQPSLLDALPDFQARIEKRISERAGVAAILDPPAGATFALPGSAAAAAPPPSSSKARGRAARSPSPSPGPYPGGEGGARSRSGSRARSSGRATPRRRRARAGGAGASPLPTPVDTSDVSITDLSDYTGERKARDKGGGSKSKLRSYESSSDDSPAAGGRASTKRAGRAGGGGDAADGSGSGSGASLVTPLPSRRRARSRGGGSGSPRGRSVGSGAGRRGGRVAERDFSSGSSSSSEREYEDKDINTLSDETETDRPAGPSRRRQGAAPRAPAQAPPAAGTPGPVPSPSRGSAPPAGGGGGGAAGARAREAAGAPAGGVAAAGAMVGEAGGRLRKLRPMPGDDLIDALLASPSEGGTGRPAPPAHPPAQPAEAVGAAPATAPGAPVDPAWLAALLQRLRVDPADAAAVLRELPGGHGLAAPTAGAAPAPPRGGTPGTAASVASHDPMAAGRAAEDEASANRPTPRPAATSGWGSPGQFGSPGHHTRGDSLLQQAGVLPRPNRPPAEAGAGAHGGGDTEEREGEKQGEPPPPTIVSVKERLRRLQASSHSNAGSSAPAHTSASASPAGSSASAPARDAAAAGLAGGEMSEAEAAWAAAERVSEQYASSRGNSPTGKGAGAGVDKATSGGSPGWADKATSGGGPGWADKATSGGGPGSAANFVPPGWGGRDAATSAWGGAPGELSDKPPSSAGASPARPLEVRDAGTSAWDGIAAPAPAPPPPGPSPREAAALRELQASVERARRAVSIFEYDERDDPDPAGACSDEGGEGGDGGPCSDEEDLVEYAHVRRALGVPARGPARGGGVALFGEDSNSSLASSSVVSEDGSLELGLGRWPHRRGAAGRPPPYGHRAAAHDHTAARTARGAWQGVALRAPAGAPALVPRDLSAAVIRRLYPELFQGGSEAPLGKVGPLAEAMSAYPGVWGGASSHSYGAAAALGASAQGIAHQPAASQDHRPTAAPPPTPARDAGGAAREVGALADAAARVARPAPASTPAVVPHLQVDASPAEVWAAASGVLGAHSAVGLGGGGEGPSHPAGESLAFFTPTGRGSAGSAASAGSWGGAGEGAGGGAGGGAGDATGGGEGGGRRSFD